MSKHLKFDYESAAQAGQDRHAQEVMQGLGITYTHSTPQSMGAQYWFWNCSNLPNALPEYIKPLQIDPLQCVGYGLNEREAEEIGKMAG